MGDVPSAAQQETEYAVKSYQLRLLAASVVGQLDLPKTEAAAYLQQRLSDFKLNDPRTLNHVLVRMCTDLRNKNIYSSVEALQAQFDSYEGRSQRAVNQSQQPRPPRSKLLGTSRDPSPLIGG